MNKKGFTLIELLAVIIVLGIVLVITIPNLTETFNKSKLKSEEAFTKRLSQTIESYISLNSSNISFTYAQKGSKTKGADQTYEVDVKKGKINNEKITFSNILSDSNNALMNESDFINAGNKKTCLKEAEIEVYRDSDYVYCHKVKANRLGCLTEKYIEKLSKDQGNNDPYAIDTCVWE